MKNLKSISIVLLTLALAPFSLAQKTGQLPVDMESDSECGAISSALQSELLSAMKDGQFDELEADESWSSYFYRNAIEGSEVLSHLITLGSGYSWLLKVDALSAGNLAALTPNLYTVARWISGKLECEDKDRVLFQSLALALTLYTGSYANLGPVAARLQHILLPLIISRVAPGPFTVAKHGWNYVSDRYKSACSSAYNNVKWFFGYASEAEA